MKHMRAGVEARQAELYTHSAARCEMQVGSMESVNSAIQPRSCIFMWVLFSCVSYDYPNCGVCNLYEYSAYMFSVLSLYAQW